MKNNFWAHKTSEIQKGAKIGKGTKIWHNCQIKNGAEIGKNCTIGHNCFVGSSAKIGHNVKIQSNTDIWNLVTLEDYVFVGPSAVFTNDISPRAKYPKPKNKWMPTLVKEGASLGANTTIICGNTIGKSAFVAAGAVVTKDVPDYAIIAGVPARIIGWVCECGNKLEFDKEETACKVCQRKYKKEGERIWNI